jgi:hypothetical protein
LQALLGGLHKFVRFFEAHVSTVAE